MRKQYRDGSGRGVLASCNARVTPTPLALMLLMALLAPWLARAEKPRDLKPHGYVNDFAGVISPDTRTKLTALCTELDQKAHAQIAIVTVSCPRRRLHRGLFDSGGAAVAQSGNPIRVHDRPRPS